MKYQRLLLGVLITFILVVAPVVTLNVLPVMAEEPIIEYDEYGDPVEPPTPVLIANGVEVQPDDEGNYYLTNSDTQDIEATGPLAGSIILNGKWQLRSDIEIEGSITVETGKFQTKDYSIYADSIYCGYYDDNGESIEVDLGKSVIDVFCFAVRGSGVVIKVDKAELTTTLLFNTATKKGHKFYNVTLKNHGTVYGFMEGENEVNDLTIEGNAYITEDVTVLGDYKVNNGNVKSYKTKKNTDGQAVITEGGALIYITQ